MTRRWLARALVAAALGLTVGAVGRLALVPVAPTEAQERVRAFLVSAKRYAFDPARIEVQQDDLVRIELRAEDIPHSFTIDEYRISKRAAPGTTLVFEFRADRAGSFRYYCNLRVDEGCRDTHGTLVVRPR